MDNSIEMIEVFKKRGRGKIERQQRWDLFEEIVSHQLCEVMDLKIHTDFAVSFDYNGYRFIFYPKSNKILDCSRNQWHSYGLPWLAQKFPEIKKVLI